MHTAALRLLAIAVFAAFAVAAIGCGEKDKRDWTPITETPGDKTSPAFTPTPPSTTTPTIVTPTPAPTKPANEGPRVTWMLASHGGASALIVRFETDVETTATLTYHLKISLEGGSGGNPKEGSTKLARQHTISIPTYGEEGFLSLEVRDASNRAGYASLELNKTSGNQFWGKGEFAPKLTFEAGRKATAAWSNLRPVPGAATQPAAIQLFSTKAACTTADSCVPAFAARFDADAAGGDAVAETHRIPLTFPPAANNYQVLITMNSVSAGGSASALTTFFYQLDVPPSAVK